MAMMAFAVAINAELGIRKCFWRGKGKIWMADTRDNATKAFDAHSRAISKSLEKPQNSPLYRQELIGLAAIA